MSDTPSSSSSSASSSSTSSAPSSRSQTSQSETPSTPDTRSSTTTSTPPPTSPNPINGLFPPLLPSHPSHPALPPKTFAKGVDPYEQHRTLYAQQNPPSAIPERCLTFCTQRADASPLCRMFCLRKRQAVSSQREDLARLRPPKIRDASVGAAALSNATPGASGSRSGGIAPVTAADTLSIATSTSAFPSSSSAVPGPSSRTGPALSSSDTATGTSQAAPDKQGSWFAGLGAWSPFDALKRALDPYSFVYVRGTPDGVVGRYMEEMEYDDGAHDFGTISRGAGKALARRREENQWEWLDWGDHGALFYLPFTSIFYPIIAIPETLKTVFAPSIELVSRYKDSWTDGTQRLNYKAFMEEVADGGATKMVDKFDKYLAERTKELKALREKQREEKESKMREATKVGEENQGST